LEINQKNLKSISSSSPNYDLSNHNTYSQTQTGATVSLSKGNLRKKVAFGEFFGNVAGCSLRLFFYTAGCTPATSGAPCQY
jgi:hypothetical protein